MHRSLWLASVAASGLAASTLPASTLAAQQGEPSVAELIAALDSPGFVDRELATHAMQNLASVSLDQLEAALTVDRLSLEQRRRLTLAARQRFMTEPRAAMGITLGEISELGLRIEGTTPGFDASAKLEAGDIIASIDGIEIRSITDLQVAIIANGPGEIVPVRYLRDGTRGEADVILGAWRDLPQGQSTPRREVLELAWRHRSRDYRSMTEPQTVESLGTPQTGAPSGRPGGARRGVRSDKPVAGGELRDGAARAVGIGVERRLSPRLDERGTDFAQLVAEMLREDLERAAQKRDRIVRLERDLERAKQRGDAESIAEYERRRDVLIGELNALEDRIERFQQVQERRP